MQIRFTKREVSNIIKGNRGIIRERALERLGFKKMDKEPPMKEFKMDVLEYVCDKCSKVYKTKRGYDNHKCKSQ